MKFEFLSVKNLQVTGWLKKQLLTQANGLHGNLDNVWRDVKDTKWLGGDGEGWERFPYFLDGYIPLAYLLNDDNLISRAKRKDHSPGITPKQIVLQAVRLKHPYPCCALTIKSPILRRHNRK
jgi:hypothetical protein